MAQPASKRHGRQIGNSQVAPELGGAPIFDAFDVIHAAIGGGAIALP
jgi:hypothetical protein